MKNLKITYLFIIILLPVLCQAQNEGGERLVHDENLENQIKFTYGDRQPIGHDILTPQTWYEIFHAPYMRDYSGNWHETYWLLQSTILTDTATQRHQRNIDTIYQKRMVEYAYRTIDLAYIFEQNEIIEKRADFYFYYRKIRNSETPNCEAIADAMKELFDEVLQKIDVIKGSHLENHKRQEAYVQYQDELDEILWHTKKLYKLTDLAKHNIFGN